jgi:hypothetical protein
MALTTIDANAPNAFSRLTHPDPATQRTNSDIYDKLAQLQRLSHGNNTTINNIINQIAAIASSGSGGGGSVSTATQIQYASTLVYPNSDPIENAILFGNIPSITSFGVIGDGVHDDTAAFQNAINSVAVPGRSGSLLIPGGLSFLISSLSIPSGITLYGYGEPSTIISNKSIPSGYGLIDIVGSNVVIQNLYIEGGYTTPQTAQYGTFGDPAYFLANTTIWVHSGCSNITIKNVTCNHTGGYFIYLDARTGNVSNVLIDGCNNTNSRPYLFGNPGDYNYGSWVGGILYESDGATYSFQNLRITNNTFVRCTGICIWGHTSTSNIKLNQNIIISGNIGYIVGFDFIQPCTVNGVEVTKNVCYLGGYIELTDTGNGYPRWYPGNGGAIGGLQAVAIDTAGIVINARYSENVIITQNGGCVSADGVGFSSICNNVFYFPYLSTDVGYTEAQTTHCGPGGNGVNAMSGIGTSNSINLPNVGAHIIISGNTMYGFGGGCIAPYAFRYSKVSDNVIFAPGSEGGALASVVNPITIGNIGSSATYFLRSYLNIIQNNVIYYTPASYAAPVAAINEDSSTYPFVGSEINYVRDNVVSNGLIEFYKDPNSGSGSNPLTLWSVTAGAAANLSSFIQDEGATTLSHVLKFYMNNAGSQVLLQSLSPTIAAYPGNLNAITLTLNGHALGNSATYTATGGQHVTSVTVAIAADGTISVSGTSS